MPNNIQPYTSQVNDITSLPDTRATPDDFGAQVGAAIGRIGGSIDQLGAAMREHQDRENSIDVQLALSHARQDQTGGLIQAENGPTAGTSGFTGSFLQGFDDYQSKQSGSLPTDSKAQKAYQVGMAALRAELADRAMQSQSSQGAALGVQKVQSTLAGYTNTVATDPTQYDSSIKAGNAAIDALNLPPLEAAKLKDGFENNAIASRFDALFSAAKSPQAMQGVVNDLTNGPWKDKMGVEQFHSLLRLATTAQKSLQTMANKQAEAAVNSIDDRIKGGAAVDPNEMAQVTAQVKQSNSPILLDKWARLQVTADTTQKAKVLSTDGLRSYIADNKGGLVNEPIQATPNSPTGRAQDGFGYLKSKYGLTDVQAMGVIANVGRETGFQPRPGDGGTSDGYFQWHLDRMTRAAAAGATGVDIRKAIDFAMSEPQGQQYLALAKAGQINDVGSAARAWLDVFEKPKSPDADQPINMQWAQRLTTAINGGRPLTSAGPQGGTGSFPSEAQWLQASAAQKVLDRRDAQVRSGDYMTAASDAGIFKLDPLNSAQDFQTRAQQSEVAQGFLGTKDNKPFTPPEVAAFSQVMQSGSLDQKTQLLQNISSMGDAAPAAFKQLGEKGGVGAMLAHVGGLSVGSPTVAEDVLRGQQAMQDNPDIKAMLSGKGTGPGPGGTPAFFDSVVGQALGAMPKDAFAARQAADALYVNRVGPGAPWNADAYTQAVRDVMGSKPGDNGGGLATVNGSPTIMPPGVNGDDFQTMVHSLQPQDLLDHSVGGGPPMDAKGRSLSATDISTEGRFRAIAAGVYHVYMADGAPAGGTGPGGLYTFRIDAKGVASITQRPQQPGFVSSILNTLETPSFWYHSSGGYGLPDTQAYKSEPSMQQQEDQINSAPPAAPIDLGRGAHVR